MIDLYMYLFLKSHKNVEFKICSLKRELYLYRMCEMNFYDLVGLPKCELLLYKREILNSESVNLFHTIV